MFPFVCGCALADYQWKANFLFAWTTLMCRVGIFSAQKRVAQWHALCIGSIGIDDDDGNDDIDENDTHNTNNNWRCEMKKINKRK